MALPTSYLTSTKNLDKILNGIRSAQAPDKFTLSFLEALEFKSSSDRLIIGVLKSLGLLDDAGRPIERYFRFLDQTQSDRVLAEGLREAYQDLFRINVNANSMSKQELINKFKTLAQGKLSDAVLGKMASTFTALAKLADFTGSATAAPPPGVDTPKSSAVSDPDNQNVDDKHHIRLGGLVYNIQLILPESRDTAVYDALFQSLRKHLL